MRRENRLYLSQVHTGAQFLIKKSMHFDRIASLTVERVNLNCKPTEQFELWVSPFSLIIT